MKNKIKMIIFIIFLSINLLNNLSYADSRIEKLNNYLNKCEKYYTFTGSVLIAEKGKILFSKGLGSRVFPRIKNTIDTKFMIGSVSKPFTAILTLKLIEEGKIKLNETVSNYLEYYPKKNGSKITIHHLLSHSAGFVDISKHYPDFFTKLMKKEYTNQKYIKLFCDLDLKFEPGAKFFYSSAGYFLLAAIIEKVTGKKFGQVLKEKILIPSGMNNSGCLNYIKPGKKMAVGYDLYNYRYTKAAYTSPSAHKGPGSMFSTVEDLFKFDRAINTDKILSKSSRDLMFKQHLNINQNVGSGYGIAIGKKFISNNYINFFAHGGVYNGFTANYIHLTENDQVIILLSNETGTKISHISNQIINILYGKKYQFLIPLSFALDEHDSVHQVQEVINEYRSFPKRYSIKMDMINGLGLTLMIKKKMKQAVAVLKFGASQYPGSSMIFSSLGTVYLKAGDKQNAIKNLKKCLLLDPKDTEAKRKLKILLK